MRLHYFTPAEFIRDGVQWYPVMDQRLLVAVDILRHQWGQPIDISPAAGALGRHLGQTSKSQHNVDVHGTVRAMDVMPRGMDDVHAVNDFLHLAEQCAFGGIGIYPDWQPRPGVHLDVRHDAVPGYPARWGALDDPFGVQQYVSMNEALEAMA